MKKRRRPYDLGENGGLPQLKEKLSKQIEESEKQPRKTKDSLYKPKKTPWRP